MYQSYTLIFMILGDSKNNKVRKYLKSLDATHPGGGTHTPRGWYSVS